jgi:hypothetical protein
MRLMRPIAFLMLLLSITACANTGLRDLRGTGDGPDDFIVNPTKPLFEPDNYKTLPAPTPGQSNITDPTPLQDGVAALGGRLGDPSAAVPSRDGAVVNHASRFGVNAGIRTTLAAEDADFRKRRGRFTQYRIVPVDRYNQAYKKQALDPARVDRQSRRAGAATPSAPLQD